MAILESVDATYALGPTIGVDRLGALVLVVAMTHRRRVVPVHRAYVITVGAILQLELPVAVVGIGRVSAQHFDAVGGSVNDLVDHGLGAAEMVLERCDVRIEASEQETTVALEPGDLRQVVRALGVKRTRIVACFAVLHLQELAGVTERPAMERTSKAALV